MITKFVLLGTGSSMGIPRADGFFGDCNPKNKKNYRSRCSALISCNDSNTLIDTSPDLRHQLLQQKIKNIDRVFYTHMHADQTHGINDLRIFYLKNKKKIPVYADKLTSEYLKNNFSYCFKHSYNYPPMLKLKVLKKKFTIGPNNNKTYIKTIPVKHGPINSIAYIINNKLAYVSDANKFYNKDLKHFMNLKFLVIDCLQFKKHDSHFNLNDVLREISILKPKKTILTNLHSDLDYNHLLKMLPTNIIPGHDGLTLNI